MFAVIKTGGKQYKVTENDVIVVEKLIAEAGSTVELDDVLMLGETGKSAKTTAKDLTKAAVFAEVLEQSRAKKVVIFKKKRRHNYRRKAGHRQNQTVLRITGISSTGVKPKVISKKAITPKKTDETKVSAKPKKAVTKPTKIIEKKIDAESKPKTKPKTKSKVKPSVNKKTKE